MAILFSGWLPAQKRAYRFTQYTTEEGLTQNMVDCIFRDSRGFMWFGTWNGLSRFDGHEFRTFSARDSGSRALGSNFVRDISEDAYGNLWFATASGLNVYLYDQDRMINHQRGDKHGLSSGKVNCILMTRDTTLWIGSERGIDRAHIKGGEGRMEVQERIRINDEETGDAALQVFTLYKDQSGRLWAGTSGGLVLMDQAGQILTRFTFQGDNIYSLSNNTVQAILQDTDGSIWVGTAAGLNRFEPATGRFYRYFHNVGDAFSLAHNSIMDMVLDPEGRLVIGTLGGISIYQAGEDLFHNYSFNPRDNSELNNEFVNCLFSDEDGNVWIGTERGGVNQYNVHQNEFEYLFSIPGEEQSLSSNTVNSVWEDGQALWVGTAGGGLNRIDKRTGSYRHFRYDEGDPGSISSDFITCIYRDRGGRLLIGTWGGGLNRLSPAGEGSGDFLRHVEFPGVADSLINNFIAAIVEDRSGRLWIGTYGGLTVYHPEDMRFDRITFPSDFMVDKIGCLNFDIYNNLWIGTEEGLYHVPAGADTSYHLDFSGIRKYQYESGIPGTLSGDYVISIMDDSYGNLWFGTYGNGLNKLESDSLASGSHRFIHYSESDGLCNNTIYGIQEDHEGRLWLSTDNGLSRLDILEERFINFHMVDGLLSNQFYWSSTFQDASGKLYFGSMKGLLSFYPDKIRDQELSPGVVLTDLKIYNRSVGLHEEYFDQEVLSHPVSVSDRIILSHKIKEFSLEFSALYYEQPEKIHYAYKMVGFDDNWHYVDSDRRYASYTNLKGGNYVFLVKSGLSDGRFGSESLELAIRILPPLWLKPWFIVMVVLLLTGSVIMYNRFRVYSLRRRQKELEHQVAERTALIRGQKEQLEKQNIEILEQRDELVDLNKKVQQSNQHQMRFFTHMSHEFKTPLTLIIAPLEQMISEVSSRSPHYRTLVLIKRNAQRLLHLINQLMEVRRIKTGKMELRASKEDLVAFIEHIIQSFYGLAEQKEIIYEFRSYPGSLETYFDRDKIENMMYNLLSNAFKYTPGGGQIRVSVEVVKERSSKPGEVSIIGAGDCRKSRVAEYAQISVKDTGYGIEEEELKHIFKRFFKIPVSEVANVQGTGIGLYLTKELIRTHKGQLYINSRKGEGTTFTILIPLGSGFLDLEEIVEGGKDRQKVVPKLHVDLLSGQMESQAGTSGGSFSTPMEKRRCSSTVLIIDDDRDMMQFMADYLGESYRVITARDGMEGLEKAREALPDLIISDIMMPHMDGIELSEKLKSNILTSHIPVILLTSRSEAQDYLAGLEVGAMDYIAKPFEIKILEAKVQNHINNQERLKRLYTSTLLDDLQNVRKVKVQDQFLQNAIKTIEENMANPQFGVRELADSMCISRSLLHKKLISSVEQSASALINSIRLKKAALLLMEGNQKVSEIAFEVGFNDPKYFSKMFKKSFGTTPSGFVEENLFIH